MKLSSMTRRKGAALVVALVVMAVLAILLTVVTVQVVSQRKLVRQRHRQLQAEWLARAGTELAAARLLQNPSGFDEENRELFPDAKVHIVVEKAEPGLYSVTVEAEMGGENEAAVVRSAQRRYRRVDKDGVIRVEAILRERSNP